MNKENATFMYSSPHFKYVVDSFVLRSNKKKEKKVMSDVSYISENKNTSFKPISMTSTPKYSSWDEV